jgi:hypothetical protein
VRLVTRSSVYVLRFFAALEQAMLGVREKAQKAHKG